MPDSFSARTWTMHRDHKRRAIARGAQIDYTVGQLRDLIGAAIGGPCPYCRRVLGDRTFSIDHVEPVGRGGSFAFENLAVCCQDCNFAKGPLTGVEFLELMLLLGAWEDCARQNTLARLKAGAKKARLRL